MVNQYQKINQYEPEEHEILELSSRTDPTFPDSNPIDFVCQYCNEDDSMGKLIRPCKCIGEFMHIDCLEILVNIGNVSHCINCKTPFPLEYERKPLIEWCRNGHAELRDTLGKFCIFLIVTIGIMIYNIGILVFIGLLCTVIDFSKTKNIDISIIVIFLIICDIIIIILSINYEVNLVINSSKRLQYAYHMWCRENSDAKVIKSLR
ncbi:E3 ubiquitin-protein ligase MARCH3-like [Pogonomyrmex barbatus]|uniref:E3 ubiquitin-protein ligase MARCH3-like n=1 Tax=Pogonomyrmex barbatus TaxID=144034 RepID=A0A6I9WD00_9HYME|nr:E3 ubiquitin-protein ligase MARCH3-like [Pogonomyrmex barbatus]